MLDTDFAFINEEFQAESVSPAGIDALWADGWRHFGTHFFRYNLGIYEFDIRVVVPLRIPLGNFAFSKSQRRTLRRNSDLTTEIGPIDVTPQAEKLFKRHRQRFRSGVPNSIYDFIAEESEASPVESREISVKDASGKLLAVSYFDIGASAVSGIYAMFDPEEARRGLGIFTMLKEIEFAISEGKELYYLGYAYEGESFYDYKKRFRPSEAFNWKGAWESYANGKGTIRSN